VVESSPRRVYEREGRT
jgi:hypothetical protein